MLNDASKSALLKAISTGQVDHKLSVYAEEILVFLGRFDPAESIAAECVRIAGTENKAKHRILRILDVLLLANENDIERIFGAVTIRKRDQEALKRRYKRLTKVFHPDRSIESAAWLNERMSIINKAMEHAEERIAVSNNVVQSDRFGTSAVVVGTPPHRANATAYSKEDERRDWFLSTVYPKLLSALKFSNLLKLFILLVAVSLLLIYMAKFDNASIKPEDSVPQNISTIDLPKPSETAIDVGSLGAVDLTDEELSALIDELLAQTSTRAKPSNDDSTFSQQQRSVDIDPLGYSDVTNKPITDPVGEEAEIAISPKLDVPNERAPVGEELTSLNNDSLLLQQLINRLEQSFTAGDASSLKSLFVADGVYLGIRGREEIATERAAFFANVDRQQMRVLTQSYSKVDNWLFVVGDIFIEYSKFGSSIPLCIPFTMTITQSSGRLKFNAIARRTKSLQQSNCT